MRDELEGLRARVEVLSLVVQELGRVLAAAQTAQVTSAVRRRVGDLAGAPLSVAADEAISAELSRVLDAFA